MSDATTEEMPWKLPVAAAIVGALLTAVYVIFTIVNAPSGDRDGPPNDIAVESAGFPSGYVAVGGDVGMRANVLRWDASGTTVFVSSTVRGGVDPDEVAPVEVASWIVTSAGGEASMTRQSRSVATPGAVTVELTPVLEAASATLTATLPGLIEDVGEVLTLSTDLPATVSDYSIVVDDDIFIVDELVVDDGGGWIRWHLEGGVAANLEVVVSIDGLAFATSEDDARSLPVWGTRGVTRLVRAGGGPSRSGSPAEITVEMYVSVVTDPGESIEIPIGSVVGP